MFTCLDACSVSMVCYVADAHLAILAFLAQFRTDAFAAIDQFRVASPPAALSTQS